MTRRRQRILDNTFAAACYNDCTTADLEAALKGRPDATDCATWNLSPQGWRDEIELALLVRREDGLL